LKLSNRVCFVTGGSRGIGRAIVEKLYTEGAHVFFTYIKDHSAANDLINQLDNNSRIIKSIKMDVSNRNSVNKAKNKFKNDFNRLDILVNNAGINKPEDFDKITDGDWDSILNINLKGPFIVTQEFLSLLKKSDNSSIINIGSVSGQYGGPRTAHYASSKAGLISLGQVIARFGAEFNIRCNTVSAGLIQSDMANEGMQSSLVAKAAESILLKRFGTQGEVADVVSFLASEESKYITAQTININGGLYF